VGVEKFLYMTGFSLDMNLYEYKLLFPSDGYFIPFPTDRSDYLHLAGHVVIPKAFLAVKTLLKWLLLFCGIFDSVRTALAAIKSPSPIPSPKMGEGLCLNRQKVRSEIAINVTLFCMPPPRMGESWWGLCRSDFNRDKI